MGKNVLIFLLSFYFFSDHSNAQQKFENKDSLYSQLKQQFDKKPEQAIIAFRKLQYLQPDYKQYMYLYAARAYKNLSESFSGTRKTLFQDSTIILLNIEIKFFGNKSAILDEKGLLAWTIYIAREGEEDVLYSLYNEIFILNKEKTNPANLQHLIRASCLYKSSKNFNDAFVIDDFRKVMLELDKKPGVKQQIKDSLENALVSCIELNCYTLSRIFESRINDPDIAKSAFSLMKTYGCTNDSLYMKALSVISINEPNFHSAYALASHLNDAGRYKDALIEIEKVCSMSLNNDRKAKAALLKSQIYFNQENYALAVKYSKESLQFDTLNLKPNSIIGQSYLKSEKVCAKDEFSAKILFLLAYQYFQKGADAEKMNELRQYLPDRADILARGYQLGDKINLTCWINETVELIIYE